MEEYFYNQMNTQPIWREKASERCTNKYGVEQRQRKQKRQKYEQALKSRKIQNKMKESVKEKRKKSIICKLEPRKEVKKIIIYF